VRADLRKLGPEARDCGLAAASVRLAKLLDAGGLGPRDAASLTRELRATYETLLKLSPPEPEKDGIDDLAARRADRRQSAG
jgi:hypothetical protein